MVLEKIADGSGNGLAACRRMQKSCSVSAGRPTGVEITYLGGAYADKNSPFH